MEAYEIIQGARGKYGFGNAAVSVYCVYKKDVPPNTRSAIHISGFNQGYRFHVAGETGEVAGGPRKVNWENPERAKQGMQSTLS